MKTEQILPLNYCAHAIEDMRELETILRGQAPASARVYRRLIEMLQHSVKFLLPNCCDLVDPEEIRQSHIDLTRLPFPCVAFEAPWDKEDGINEIGEFRQSPATKRIALCWEARPEYEVLPGLNDVLAAFPDGGAFVVPIYWSLDTRRWTVGLGGTFVPYENTVEEVDMTKSLPASRIAHTATIEAGLAKPKAKHFRAEPFYLLPEFYEKTLAMYGGDRAKTYAQIMLDSRDEAMMLVQACSVINCANVTTAQVAAPLASNKKRQEKGKQPFFTYKVLQLSNERLEAGNNGGGNHSSLRMHLRRGHLRRLESKTVWVRPAMINAGSSDGVVLKDYAVPPAPLVPPAK